MASSYYNASTNAGSVWDLRPDGYGVFMQLQAKNGAGAHGQAATRKFTADSPRHETECGATRVAPHSAVSAPGTGVRTAPSRGGSGPNEGQRSVAGR